ncbi:MAG TPA: Gfo/Idh/MocA family oxidoreductase [Gaiellaceae bacterium]
MSRVRLALLSTAAINRAILGARADDAPFEVVAVASRDAGRAHAYAQEHGIARSHGSYAALLADPDVDAVYVALPNALHHEWTMRALEAGKHVICEKPYTRHPDEVEEAWARAESDGLVLTEAYMWRHSAQTALLRELLPQVGTVRSVHATFSFVLDRDWDVRLDAGLGGGSLLDLGCYCISACRLVAGEPERVHGERYVGRGGVDDAFAAVLRFPNDVLGTFQCSFTSGPANRIEILGSDGSIVVPQAFVNPPGIVVLNGGEHRVDPGNHYRAELDDFCAAIRGERGVLNDRAEMLGQARVLDALL